MVVCGIWGWGANYNEPVNATHSKEAKEGDFPLHLHGGVGRGFIPPTIGGRPCIQRERQHGGKLTTVKMTLYLKRRECGMVHIKLNIFPYF